MSASRESGLCCADVVDEIPGIGVVPVLSACPARPKMEDDPSDAMAAVRRGTVPVGSAEAVNLSFLAKLGLSMDLH